MKCKFYFSLLLLFLSVFCSPAPTPNFSSPPFNAHDFIVDQPNNNISLRGSSNTIPIGVYPVKITNLTGTNYYSIDSTGVPSGYILLTTNNTVAYFPFSGGAGGIGTLTNVVFTNAGPSDTYVIGNISYLKTNSFSGSGGTTYFFNTNDFSVTGTNVNLSSNIPHTNSANTFYGTQTFQSRINVGTSSQIALFGNGSGSGAAGLFSWTASGDVTGTSFTGIGSGLTALNAGNLSSGTVSFARLPSDVVTNAVFTNAGPDSMTINNINYVNTNKFGGGGGITALTGDVTASGSGSVVATLANIPTSTPMAGSLFDTAIVAPATPASGKGQIYEDSTSKNLAIKNDAGVINHGVQTRTATANQWIRSIADDGSTTISQPAFTDISGTAAAAQIPVATTSANGGVKVDGTSIIISGGIISAVGGSGLPTINGNGTNETFWGLTQLTNSTSGNGVSFDGTSLLLDGVNLNTGSGGTIGGVGSGLVQLNASGISSGTLATARMGSGTPQSTNVLHGNGTWSQVSNADISTNGSSSGQFLQSSNGVTMWGNPPTGTGTSVTNINPIVATNTGPFFFYSGFSSGPSLTTDIINLGFDATNSAFSFTGFYNGLGTHTNIFVTIPVISASTNIAAISTLATSPTNQFVIGTVYTNVNQRSIIIGLAQLTGAATGTANITVFYTNNGTGFQMPMVTGSIASTVPVSFSIPLSPLATFRITSTFGTGASGYITNCIRWDL